MNNVRIIPRLDIKGPNLVKGIHLEGLRVLGRPENYARFYYEQGADELLYMDVVASLYERNTLHDFIEKTARNIFIPLTVAGGIRSINDILMALRAGADKVAINTAAVKTPSFITDAANKFGSSNIVVSIEAKKTAVGTYEAYIDNGRESTGLDAIEWAKQSVELGAGEILLTSVDREGTGKGFEMDLVRLVSREVSVPVIACGGAGSVSHVEELIADTEVKAVALASLLHYHYIGIQDIDTSEYSSEGNIEFLRSNKGFTNVKPSSIPQLKEFLESRQIACRPLT